MLAADGAIDIRLPADKVTCSVKGRVVMLLRCIGMHTDSIATASSRCKV